MIKLENKLNRPLITTYSRHCPKFSSKKLGIRNYKYQLKLFSLKIEEIGLNRHILFSLRKKING